MTEDNNNWLWTDIDECASNPCQDGGSCIDQINGYTCNCSNSTTGVNCERGKAPYISFM